MNTRSQNDPSQVPAAASSSPGGTESGNGRSQMGPGAAAAPAGGRSIKSRWANSDDLSFELGKSAIPVRLVKGQYVSVKTIWGQPERGMVLGFAREDGFPLVELLMDRGDHIYVNVAYCTPEEGE